MPFHPANEAFAAAIAAGEAVVVAGAQALAAAKATAIQAQA